MDRRPGQGVGVYARDEADASRSEASKVSFFENYKILVSWRERAQSVAYFPSWNNIKEANLVARPVRAAIWSRALFDHKNGL